MAVTNSLQTQTKSTFSVFMSNDKIRQQINEIVGKDSQMFMTSILSAVSTNPALAECEHTSILSCAFLGQTLKLSPSPQLGQYYMVPFDAKATDEKGNPTKIKKATFILGYKGYIQLAIRSGQYRDIDCIEIREGEYIGRESENGKFKFAFIENECTRLSKPIIGYLAYFELLNGFKKAVYWSKEHMEMHADQYSKAFKLKDYKRIKAGEVAPDDMWKYSSFWYKNFDEMAFKTLLRHLISRWGIMSIDMQKAFDADIANDIANGDTQSGLVGEAISAPQQDEKSAEVSKPGTTSKEPEHKDVAGDFFGEVK